MRLPSPRSPARRDVHHGLAYWLWVPDAPRPWPGVVVLHGAGSQKENHADYARAAADAGFAALAFDQRGHGASEGSMGPGAVSDVRRMVRLLADEPGVDARRVGLRGSSMGGNLAIHAAAISDEIAAVVAICPAGEQHLRAALDRAELSMRVDRPAMEAWLGEHDVRDAVALVAVPVLLVHAEGDESIPAAHSRELAEQAAHAKLMVLPGGDHRSLQHDAEVQGETLRWLERAMARR